MIARGLTVGKLRTMLSSVPDDVVVALFLGPPTKVDDEFTTIYQVVAEYSGGPVFKLRPTTAEWHPMDLAGSFLVSGRGLAVPLSDVASSKAIPGTMVEVEICSPDGTVTTLWASVELVLRRDGGVTSETVTLVLRGAPENGFSGGTIARFRGAA